MSSKHHSKSPSKPAPEANNAKIGFVGAGKITEAMVNGLINYGKIEAGKIHVSATSSKNLEGLKSKYGVHVTKRNIDIFGKYDCDVVFIATPGSAIKKCFSMGGERPHPLCTNFIPNMKHPLFVMSLVTGFSLDQIKKVLLNPEHPDKYQIEMHRMVINTAAAYGLGLAAVDTDPEGRKFHPLLRALLSPIAKIEQVQGDQMDAACALAGAGLAFVSAPSPSQRLLSSRLFPPSSQTYYFLAALADGGVKMGLSRDVAVKFSAKTLLSASQSILESDRHPSELKDEVAGPKGPAAYGLHVLDKANAAAGISGAVEAAHKRAKELAEGSS